MLHQFTAKYMRGENTGHTLQTTCLINEAILCLIDSKLSGRNRTDFMTAAINTMRIFWWTVHGPNIVKKAADT